MCRISLLLLLVVASRVAAIPPADDDTGSIIVKLAADVVDAQAASFSVTSAGGSAAANDLGKPIGRRLRRMHRNPSETLEQQLNRVSSMAGVEYAVPDMKVVSAAVRATSQEEDGAAVPQALPAGASRGIFRQLQWGDSRVGMQNAWNIAVGAKKKVGAVTVCIVDSGIDSKHPGLVANLAKGVGMNAVDGEDETDLTDVLGHGTTLAGVIAGSGADGGAVGINWRNVNLLSCKFMSPLGFGRTSDAVQCLDYCLEAGARIISASWTTGNMPNPPLEEAVARTAEVGALLVVAAGNFAANMRDVPYFPQVYSKTYPNMLVVAASDNYDDHAFFSNFDPATVHISAPGLQIYSTAVGGGYAFTHGTSIAAPFVSGAAALLQAVAQDTLGTTLSAAELKQRLLDSAEVLPALAGRTSTGARLRVDWALQLLLGKRLSPVTPCIAAPGQQRRKCSGGRGGGRLPAKRRSLVEVGGSGTAVAAAQHVKGGEEGSEAQQAQQQQAVPRARSEGMQRELLRQLEQQSMHRQLSEAQQAQQQGQQQRAGGEVQQTAARRSRRRMQEGGVAPY